MSVLQLLTLLYTVRLSSSSSPCTLYVCPPAPHPVHCTSVLQLLTLLHTVRLSSSSSPYCTLYVYPPAPHPAHCTSILQLLTLHTVRLSSSSSPYCTLYVCPPAPHPTAHCTSVLQLLTLLHTVRLSSSSSPYCTLYVCPPALHPAAHLDPAEYDVYGCHGNALGVTSLNLAHQETEEKLTQKVSSSSPETLLGSSRELLSRFLKSQFLPGEQRTHNLCV